MSAQVQRLIPTALSAASAAHLRRLDPGVAVQLSPAGGELTVVSGRVWLTRDLPAGPGQLEQSGDVVLQSGQQLRLAPGEHVVIEAWGDAEGARVRWAPARQDVVASAQALALRGLAFLAGEAALGLRGAAGAFAALARSAASSASRAQGCIDAGDSMACSGALK